MSDFAREILPISLEDEMQQSYLSYAMSVIVGRALPDVRDGLKPVHRRVLYAMNELGNSWNKPYKKSARIVGDVIGKYHPHGDTAVYDTIVRMAQPFSLRYMLVDGQGNFGSIDGDSPAAMRYTEVRMSKIAHELLADLEKETVNFTPNYDGSESEPDVLPTRIPNLLVNGSSGIAVGMATNIPPHNLNETISACIALIDNPELNISELMEFLPGPDFPTHGIINGTKGIREAYETGRGRVQMRARTSVETDKNGKSSIIVHEIPYQVNKAKLIERIAELVKEKKIEGISALRDESDKDGMRIVIEVKRGEVPEVLINNLYKQTTMQTVFGINMVALINGQPKLLNLKDVLEAFIRHRREVVTRRTIYDLRKAREKAHILEGLALALNNIDEMIELIKASPSPSVAKERMLERDWSIGNVEQLLEKVEMKDIRPEDLPEGFGSDGKGVYKLSPVQAQAILEMRLHRLTGLEQDKIIAEYRDLVLKIAEFLEILRNPDRLTEVVREELEEVVENFGDKRRTEIDHSYQDIDAEDLIAVENRIVTLSRDGYIKTQPLSDYQAQRRGGRGKSATQMKEDDEIGQMIVASTHDMLLCFSNRGKLYWQKTWQLPLASRGSKGKPIVNVLPLETGEHITSILPVSEFSEGYYVFMATKQSTVKRVALSDFSRPRANGIIAVDLLDDDELVGTAITDGEQDIMLFSNIGKAIRFDENDVRVMGRQARGVRGMKLKEDMSIISMQVARKDTLILTATEHGYGKCTPVDDYSTINRGGQGVISIKTSDRNGNVVYSVAVTPDQEVVLITNKGTLVRTRVSEISVVGRNTQGVKLINVGKGEIVVGLAVVDVQEDELPDIDSEETSELDQAPDTSSEDNTEQ
ncbi:DNA gyrase subunit A [Hydrogenovibrio crunogenus]|uniref:DNA gyrase subunit A n=1 Tax=Hydrogenovibrio crunogenus TaxID=39765 RepID=A0A4P7NZS2_9GAMM|nr:DNA gyrase subunit A [Hydrogenovibrio crunogenus]QBZ83218.1 DNA gyrase subunit A [Hydrogenovibrio crunogenus]RUM93334.1 MAG: DNA gyrase subunit A [Thiomicrospira sp.]